MDVLVQTWLIHNRINLYLLDALSAEQLAVKPDKGRANDAQFAHIHNVRLMWVKAVDPARLEGLSKLEAPFSAESLRAGLEASAAAIADLLRAAGEPSGRIKGFKPNAAAFLGYMISHESHHRGMIEIGLRQAGLPVSDKVSFGLWEWGSR
jgi:hypothetical protein